jgi:hypothetical protein
MLLRKFGGALRFPLLKHSSGRSRQAGAVELRKKAWFGSESFAPTRHNSPTL